MEVLIFLGGIAILAVAIWLDYYIAKQFESVANAKGYIGAQYFHLCFWLGMIGYLLIIALPDRGKINAGNNPADELPEL